jgi:hypothetical protein
VMDGGEHSSHILPVGSIVKSAACAYNATRSARLTFLLPWRIFGAEATLQGDNHGPLPHSERIAPH